VVTRIRLSCQPSEQAAEVVFDGSQDGIGGLAGTACEVVASHSMLGLDMADHGSTAARRRRSRPITAVTPRFWPEM